MEEFRKKYFTDVTFISVLTVIARMRGLILLPVISRLIGLEGYGIWLQVSLTVGLMGNVFEVGLHSALVRFIPSLKKREDIADMYYSVLLFALSLGIIAAFVIYAFADVIAKLSLQLADVGYLFRIACVLVPINLVILMQQNYFRARMRVKLYSTLDVLANTGDVIGILVVLTSGAGLREMFIAVILWRLTLSLVQALMIWRDTGIGFPKFRNFRELLAFSLPLVPSTIAGNTVRRFDRYLVGYFLGAAAVGLYGAATAIAELIDNLTIPLRKAITPYIANLWDRKLFQEVRLYLGYSMKAFLFFAIPAAVLLSVFSRKFISILATEEFLFSNMELAVVSLAFAAVFFSSNRIMNLVFIIQKRTIAVPIMQIVEASLNLALNLVLIPLAGIIGAAVSKLVSYLLAFLVRRIYIVRRTEVDPTKIYDLFAVKCLMASVVIGGISVWASVETTWHLLGFILIDALIYIFLLWLFKSFQSKEIQFVKDIFRRRSRLKYAG
jgi:O-antigen/teichoic acid export membrane protein